MKSFAIILVCYKRLNGLKRLLSSLEKVDYHGRNDINLVFSIDYSGSKIIEDFANSYEWKYGPKYVRAFQEKCGLKDHILSCGDLTEQFDVITVLEDDLYVSDSFFSYAESAADFYSEDRRIGGISLYAYQKNWLNWLLRFEPQKSENDAYFMKIAQSWGQVWTREQWSEFRKWYEDNSIFIASDDIPPNLSKWPQSSWLKYYCLYLIRTNKFFVYPYFGLSTNCSEAGEHNSDRNNDYQVELVSGKKNWSFGALNYDSSIIYDEYMTRAFLGQYLGVSNEDLTVDFYGTKNKRLFKRYVLSPATMDYHVLNGFELSFHPIEVSVIENIKGNELLLYDTTIKEKHKKGVNGKEKLFVYSLRSANMREVSRVSFSIRIKNLVRRVSFMHRKR